jgi:Zn-dependent protease with chaperone function
VIEFDAVYYDGRTSRRTAVRVRASGDALHVSGPELNIEVPLAAAVIDPPVGDTRRVLHLPGGAQLQTADEAAIAVLFPRANRVEEWVHGLERRWAYALAAVIVTGGFAWWCVVFGLPLAARIVAATLPVEIERTLGEQTLAAVDNSFCAPTALDAARQAKLRKTLQTVTAGIADAHRYRLELRACHVGPNAFAIPGGAIVLTDELAKLAQNEQQLAAVLAHEVGHVKNRHGLRMALQAAGVSVLVAAIAGDAVSITSLAVALPTALLQSGYSREFEYEADTYAYARLKALGISPRHFADILTRMEALHSKRPGAATRRGKGADKARDYFSTHPMTAERIERALANQ